MGEYSKEEVLKIVETMILMNKLLETTKDFNKKASLNPIRQSLISNSVSLEEILVGIVEEAGYELNYDDFGNLVEAENDDLYPTDDFNIVDDVDLLYD